MVKLLFLLLLFCIVCEIHANSKQKSFDGYSVIRVVPKTKEQLMYLHDLAMTTTELDFWTYPKALNQTVDIMVSPEQKSMFNSKLRGNNLVNQIWINDVGDVITKQKNQKSVSKLRPEFRELVPGYYDNYQRLADIYAFLDVIHASAPDITEVETIGQSTENRPIKLIKIGVGLDHTKPVIFIDTAIHAREWITAATSAYFIEHLVNGYLEQDQGIVTLLNTFDFYIVPVVNTDGYEYTHTNNRLWRKTRSFNFGSSCIGTDPNRNWGYEWGGPGTSDDPCSEIYHGTEAFSEPETKAVSDYILSIKSRVRVYLATHSYSQMWLYPWGYTSELTPDDAQLTARAITAVNVLAEFGTQYIYGTSTNILYEGAGGADDWAYGSANVKYSYTVELRDTGYYGFLLPADQIIGTGIETSAAIKAIALDAFANP